jgi:NhaP-type Na+/H+ or K+/H+ antiporter
MLKKPISTPILKSRLAKAVIRVLFPNLTYISCLVVAACLTPTDPIICATIVGGKYAIKHVPVNLRQILSAESAANDGLAYPFLSISIYLITETSRRTAITKWFLVGWLCKSFTLLIAPIP